MGKMMPLKWIEQAEARQVWVIATSERMLAPRSPMAAVSLKSSLVRLRSWIAPSDEERGDKQSTPHPSAGIVRLRRARRSIG
jgi:hypothetical protein